MAIDDVVLGWRLPVSDEEMVDLTLSTVEILIRAGGIEYEATRSVG